jgi:drug/metabolite transporter (DMT)-like permease
MMAGGSAETLDSDQTNSAFRVPHSAFDQDSAFRVPRSALKASSPPNPAIAVVYGNLLLAILCATSGISALPVMTSTDWFAVSFLGIIQIGIAYVLFIKGVTGGTRPLDASIIGFIEPLLNPVWVFWVLGERPSGWAVLGGSVIIATVVAHTVVQYRKTEQTIHHKVVT